MPTQNIRVIKRDGTPRKFNPAKIVEAIDKATTAENIQSLDKEMQDKMLSHIISKIQARRKSYISVDEIQNHVEETLMVHAPSAVAKHYILFRQQRDKQRPNHYDVSKIDKHGDLAKKTPWGPLGFVTYARTYSRPMLNPATQQMKQETWRDTILRVLDACQKQLQVGFTVEELHEAYAILIGLKGSVAGRFLWQLGTTTVDKYGLMSLENCAFCKIDSIESFTWTMDVLMMGTGCGVSVERENVAKLPPVLGSPENAIVVTRMETADADFIVPDSRQGWVALLEKTLTAFLVTGKGFSYSTILVRGRDTPISGFGGVASGPDILVQGIHNICGILTKRMAQSLRTIDALDIVNIIGSIVVAGNVRRSAIIALGSPDDVDFLQAKRWDFGTIPNWRCHSNNSVVCDDISELHAEFWEGYNGNGEPYGLWNKRLSQTAGRIVDEGKYGVDPDVCGVNPCGEQSLCNWETCCLAEVFLSNITSYDELKRVGKVLYRICKHSLRLKCHQEKTQEIVWKNSRIGIGITGLAMCTAEQKNWLSEFYVYLRELDTEYSAAHGFPRSIKLTTVKPSGTLSLLAGVTSGAHPGFSQYYTRRIRIASSNPLVKLCRENGYHVEPVRHFDGELDTNTMVVEFPMKLPPNTQLAEETSAIAQLELVKELQNVWSDNGVSVTVYYKREEIDAMKAWLALNYRDYMKGCSFLLHSDHGFVQAPLEKISKEQYFLTLGQTVPITEATEVITVTYSLQDSTHFY
jgi:transcriptional regulator NrdR family protein